MISKGKIAAIIGGALLVFWIGYSVSRYYSFTGTPDVTIVGLNSGGHYKGIMNCSLQGNNKYKLACVDMLLDGKPLQINRASKVRAKTFNVPFEINTSDMTNGLHVLDIHCIDASRHHNEKSDRIEFFVDNLDLTGAFLTMEHKVEQGHTLHPQIQLNKQVEKVEIKVLNKVYNCYPVCDGATVYEAFIPIDCDENPAECVMNAEILDYVGHSMQLTGVASIKEIDFPKQRGFTVAAEKLEEEKEVSMSNKILSDALDKWLLDSPKKKMWNGSFDLPTIVLRYSTPFGEVRTTPERGRYVHKAVDIVNHPKSVVWAAQTGNVIIKDRYLHSGNTVVIDHGLGVFSLYYHLDSFADIEVGDLVKKGNPIGRIGMTGYSNGYHLHWEMRVGGVQVDPLQWTKKTF